MDSLLHPWIGAWSLFRHHSVAELRPELYGVRRDIGNKETTTLALRKFLGSAHQGPAVTVPLQRRAHGKTSKYRGSRLDTQVNPHGSHRDAIDHEKKWMVGAGTIVGMALVIDADATWSLK